MVNKGFFISVFSRESKCQKLINAEFIALCKAGRRLEQTFRGSYGADRRTFKPQYFGQD